METMATAVSERAGHSAHRGAELIAAHGAEHGDELIADDDVLFPPPDAVDRVTEVTDLMTVFAAERLARVAELRDGAIARGRASDRGVALQIIDRSVRLELAAALQVSEHAAGDMLALAEAVVHEHPSVLAAMQSARVTEQHARILVQVVGELDPDARDDFVRWGLEIAAVEAVGPFRRRLRRRADDLRAHTLAERHREAVQRRRIWVEAGDDGMGWLNVHAPIVELRAIHGRATAMAGALVTRDGEQRTLDQLRADVVCDLLIDGETASTPSEARGIRPTVAVTVPVLTLMDDGAGEFASIEGIGPIPTERARELCGASDGWMRVLTHPETGVVLSVGRDRYRPPASLRRLVRWRSERCMAPGCGMPADRCQIDHNLAWAESGCTEHTNLAPFCQGHHTVKHHGGWRVRQLPDSGGAIEWISPAGRRYVVEPERRIPVFRTAHPPAGPPPF